MEQKDYTVSVIIPARNEKGNIARVAAEVPKMGNFTEIIFVEGGSTDGTAEEIKKVSSSFSPEGMSIKYLAQTGKGKGNAVKEGFRAALGEILIILDADLAVEPQELPKLYSALASGKTSFVNCNRFFYPMEKSAMRFFNLLGNKFFALLFSFITKQKMHDILCGTKVMFKKDFEAMEQNSNYLNIQDPGGDLDFLFGAAILGLKIKEMPVHYKARTYGSSNFLRWSHGWRLLKICFKMLMTVKFSNS